MARSSPLDVDAGVGNKAGEPKPRIVVALPDRWECVLLSAELRERGYLAGCAERLTASLLLAHPELVGPTRAVLCDYEVLCDLDVVMLRWLRALGQGPAVALLLRANADVSAGPWDRVLHRPLTIGAVAEAIELLLRQEAPPPRDAHVDDGVCLRVGAPWPAGLCARCGKGRHCQPPGSAIERERVRIGLVQFALEHRHDDQPGDRGPRDV